jgi:predicted ATP-grasp superfamily ATP-dependent carboligase
MEKRPVVVLRSNDNCFLDVIRALGKADIPVIPVVFSYAGAGLWISEKSVYYENPVIIKNPAENPVDAKNQLVDLGAKLFSRYKSKCLLMSTSDTGLVFLQGFFDDFEPYFLQMGHEDFGKSILSELNKNNFSKIMEENDIPVPPAFAVSRSSDIKNAVDNITYPCIYKPAVKDMKNSFQSSHNEKKAKECKNSSELEVLLRKEIENGYELIVQEKIYFEKPEDEASCYIYRDKNGNIRAANGVHKVAEYPKPYGTGVVVKLFHPEELLEIAKKVVLALDWRGFLCIEFIYDSAKKRWVVIEANMRAWLTNNFQTTAGINFAQLLYLDCMDMLPKFTETYKSKDNNFLQIQLPGFIKSSLIEHSDEREALISILDFMKNIVGKIVFASMEYGDEEPGVYEYNFLKEVYKNNVDILEQIYLLIQKNNNLLYNR